MRLKREMGGQLGKERERGEREGGEERERGLQRIQGQRR